MTDEQLHIIISKEIGSEYPGDTRYYNAKCAMPSWPGGESGVTIGIGYDLGYNKREQIRKDWEGKVNSNILVFILSVAGVKGELAKKMITEPARRMRIPYEVAKDVFLKSTLPRFTKLANDTYPGLNKLNDTTQAVIIGLVYNRGASFGEEGKPSWDSRKEMRELAPVILAGDYNKIAELIESMSRLWVGKGMDGLVSRRKEEAELIKGSV